VKLGCNELDCKRTDFYGKLVILLDKLTLV
jgi:hypothetical protein